MPQPTPCRQLPPGVASGRRANLTTAERHRAFEMLLECSTNGVLPYGAHVNTARHFGVHPTTIWRLWVRAQRSLERGSDVADVASKIKCNSGRPKLRTANEIEAVIKSVDQHARQTLRALAAASSIPKTTIVAHMKETKRLRARSSYVKPFLTPGNIKERLKFALSFLRPRSSGTAFFVDMFEYVHVDEKWFYLTKAKKKFYVYDDEDIAARSCKSKRFITKVMFLCAVARPRYDAHKKCSFDGKIGVWPFVVEAPAQRTSKNRPKGAIVTTTVTVDAQVYLNMITSRVVPAVLAKMPRATRRMCVSLQQDNASPHRVVTTETLQRCKISGIKVANQPPNSPDFNVLDLGFFNSIQSLQHQKKTQTIEELIGAVESAFYGMPPESLAKTFVSLQSAMLKSIEVLGGNNYKLAHLKKEGSAHDLSRINLECPVETYNSAIHHLNSPEQVGVIQ